MRKVIGSLIIAGVLFGGIIIAQAGDFGLGIIVGAPTGLSGKLWLTDTTAMDGAAAWSLDSKNHFLLHIDYLYHNFDLLKINRDKVDKSKTAFYYGFGGRIKFREGEDSQAGLRIPVGIEHIFVKAPYDIFFEIAPILNLVPETSVDLDAGLGVRFFFP
jgi:hypothetical protein